MLCFVAFSNLHADGWGKTAGGSARGVQKELPVFSGTVGEEDGLQMWQGVEDHVKGNGL